MAPAYIERPRGIVRVAGRDARTFLQNTITIDIDPLDVSGGAYSLLLTPKGRVIADMTVLRTAQDTFVLVCEPHATADLVLTLKRYRLASKVTVEDVSAVFVALESVGPGPGVPTALGALTIVDLDAAEASRAALGRALSTEEWTHERVARMIPLHGSDFDETTLPAEASLDTRAISFEKGCYIGQEPVARLHYRGHPNRVLRRLALGGPIALPATLSVEREVGRITTVSGETALGYVRREVDHASELTARGSDGVEARVRILG